MKSKTRMLLVAVLVFKIMLASMFIFRVKTDPVFWGMKAMAAEQEKTVEIHTNRPDAGPEDNKIDMGLLIQKKADLQAQEEALAKQKVELAAIREDINSKFEKLSQLRNEIKTELARKETIERQKLKHLIKAYSAMKPQNAAALIEKLDQKFAVELLANLKGETVGGILSFMEKDKAAKIIEGLAAR